MIVYVLLTNWEGDFKEMLHIWEGWFLLGIVVIRCVTSVIRNYYLYWNRDSEYEDKL